MMNKDEKQFVPKDVTKLIQQTCSNTIYRMLCEYYAVLYKLDMDELTSLLYSNLDSVDLGIRFTCNPRKVEK